MNVRVLSAAAMLAAGFLVSRPAAAITITMEPAKPVQIGQTQTFRIAKVDQAVGNVSITWDFGDGTTAGPGPELQATHVYKEAGNYPVIVSVEDTADTGGASFTQIAHNPLTAAPPHNSSSIFVDEERHTVWNVNPDSDSVSVIDSRSLKRYTEVPVGKEPHSLAPAPDGTVWVANQKSDEIVVLDRANGNLLARIALPYASQPLSLAFGPSGKAYVSLFATGFLVEIDVATRHVERSVSVGPTPAGVSVAADGRVFVTRLVSPVDHGEVWVVSPDTLTVKNTIVLPFDDSQDSAVSGRGVPNFVSSIVISPDGTQGWVSAKKDNVVRGPMRDGLHMNSDNFVRSIICAVDLKTEKELVAKRQDLDNRSMPVTLVFSPLGNYAYLMLMLNNEISITDAYNGVNYSAIRDVGHGPDGLALAADGKVFVNATLSREVIVYNLQPSIDAINQTAPMPITNIRTIDNEPLPPAVLLGKQIFFNAMDTRMSSVGYMTCATCHFGGISDGRVWDFTDRGEGLRNTKSLLGIRGAQGEGRLHWSANMDEIQDFERDIRDSQGGFGFMPKAEYDARKTATDAMGNPEYDTFGKPAAGASKELDALAAFVTSLDKVPRSPFRNPDGSYTDDALKGRDIFVRAGCDDCHTVPDYSDSPAGKLHDVGTILRTSGYRLGGPLTGTDTPQLKGVWQTAPYLHDGRAVTLMEIFTKYLTKDQMGKTSDLTPTELAQLVEYLQEIDDVPETPRPPEKPPETSGLFGCAIGSLSRSPSRGGLAAWLLVGATIVALRRRQLRDGCGSRGLDESSKLE